MAKVFFVYGPMNSSKTASLIMASYNYREEGQNTVILKPALDNRDGVEPIIKSRPGNTAACTLVSKEEDLFKTVAILNGATDADIEWLDRNLETPAKLVEEMKQEILGSLVNGFTPVKYPTEKLSRHEAMKTFGERFEKRVDCVLIDEVQFISEAQAEQLLDIADYLDIPVMAYGLRNDFKGNGFPASLLLMSQAESLRENKGICWCGSKATHVLRIDENGNVDTDGPQIKVGGNDSYKSVCRYHFREGKYKK